MLELMLTFAVFALVMLALALGVIFKNRPIAGSCGGLNQKCGACSRRCNSKKGI